MNHYRCFNCFIPEFHSTRNGVTTKWLPHSTPFPKITADDYLRQTDEYMLSLIQQKSNTTIPSLTYGSNINNNYIQIAQILKQATTPPPAPPPRVPEPTKVPTPTPTPAPRVTQSQPAPALRVPTPPPRLPAIP